MAQELDFLGLDALALRRDRVEQFWKRRGFRLSAQVGAREFFGGSPDALGLIGAAQAGVELLFSGWATQVAWAAGPVESAGLGGGGSSGLP